MVQKMEYETPLQERFINVVNALINHYKVSAKDIAAKIGYAEATISRIRKGETVASGKHATLLSDAYPIVNVEYIIKGNGNMFLDDKMEINEAIQSYNIVKSTKKPKTLAIYDFDVQAGSMPLFDDVSKDPIESISFLGSEQCDFAVKVHGESMTGKIANGGIIAVKEIYDKDIIPYGHIFLIFTHDLRMVKYIKKSKLGDAYVRLVSHNSSQYEDFDIPREKIVRLFIVKKILNDES